MIIVKQWRSQGFRRKETIVTYSDGPGPILKKFDYRKANPGENAENEGNVPVPRSLAKAFSSVQTMEVGQIDAIFVETL